MHYSIELLTEDCDPLGSIKADSLLAVPNVGDQVVIESNDLEASGLVLSRMFHFDAEQDACRVFLYCEDSSLPMEEQKMHAAMLRDTRERVRRRKQQSGDGGAGGPVDGRG